MFFLGFLKKPKKPRFFSQPFSSPAVECGLWSLWHWQSGSLAGSALLLLIMLRYLVNLVISATVFMKT